jgi:hypothetical protein
VVLDRFVVPLQTSIGIAKALERIRFIGPVRQDRQRLLEVFDGLVVAAQLVIAIPQIAKRESFVPSILDLAGDGQRLLEVFDGLVIAAQ